jgi:leucyl aminopeptidase
MSVATLTGNAEQVSGGHSIIGYGNVEELMKIGNEIDQPIDKLNVYPEMIEKTKDKNIIKNHSKLRNGSGMATAFLMNFIKGDYIHLDIASVVIKNSKVTEFGFELLSRFL